MGMPVQPAAADLKYSFTMTAASLLFVFHIRGAAAAILLTKSEGIFCLIMYIYRRRLNINYEYYRRHVFAWR